MAESERVWVEIGATVPLEEGSMGFAKITIGMEARCPPEKRGETEERLTKQLQKLVIKRTKQWRKKMKDEFLDRSPIGY